MVDVGSKKLKTVKFSRTQKGRQGHYIVAEAYMAKRTCRGKRPSWNARAKVGRLNTRVELNMQVKYTSWSKVWTAAES
jgi:hypothetical protein